MQPEEEEEEENPGDEAIDGFLTCSRCRQSPIPESMRSLGEL